MQTHSPSPGEIGHRPLDQDPKGTAVLTEDDGLWYSSFRIVWPLHDIDTGASDPVLLVGCHDEGSATQSAASALLGAFEEILDDQAIAGIVPRLTLTIGAEQ